MGLYVEPPNGENKECFLYRIGEIVSKTFETNEEKEKFWKECNQEDCFPVVNVWNGHFGGFFASGVAFSKEEFQEFTLKDDLRRKTIFKVKKEVLKTCCPQWSNYIDEKGNKK